MVLTAIYIAAAMVLAPSIFLAAEWIAHDQRSRPPHRMAYSVLAAALWPLLAIGLVQFAVVAAVRQILLARASGTSLHPFADETDTAQLPRLTVPYVRVQMGTPAI